MFIRMRYKLLIFLLVLAFPLPISASDQFISIVNPIRISSYNPDALASLNSELSELNSQKLTATWLFSYDALIDQKITNAVKNFPKSHELGLLLEVTPTFASASGVTYRNTGSWHHANSVFLSGYPQSDRIKLIDTLFSKFKFEFGYYPTSIGSWWTDSYSLTYLRNKYGVTANLTCADQFSTDGYQIWGQYWSTPYYPYKFHTGIPASNIQDKLDVVVTQWAHRDPVDGYVDSTFSTQDYFTRPNKEIDYFEKLVRLYAFKHSNKFGHITLGLEGDFSPQVYTQNFRQQLEVVKKVSQESVEVVTMSQFSDWYRKKFSEISPTQLIQSDSASWFQSPFYRIGYTKSSDAVTIRDLRIYTSVPEPFYTSPNGQNILHINIFSLIDSISDPSSIWKLPPDTDIVTLSNKIIITPFDSKLPINLEQGFKISRDKNSLVLSPLLKSITDKIITGFSIEANHFFASKKFPLKLLIGQGWQYLKKEKFTIPVGEQEVLSKLKKMPQGKILILNDECIQCNWHTPYPPAIYANHREYVGQLTSMPVIKNSEIIRSTDRNNVQDFLKKENIRYIYLVKFEDYIEKLALSPGDYNAKLIYENANAQAWEVVK